MPGTIRIRRSLVEAAADELETTAHSLLESSTINGQWPAGESETKEEYDFLIDLVCRLREALA